MVVGGGITGLVLCHELQRRGAEVRLLEERDRPGGVIGSVEREGRVLELGPQRTRLTASVHGLVRELELADELVEAPAGLPLFVYRDGGLRPVPTDLRQFIGTDLLSWPGKLRLLLEPLTGGLRGGESVGAYLERSVGREAYCHLFGPLYGGIYASDPRRMPAEFSLARAMEAHGIGRSLLVGLARRLLDGSGLPPAVSFRRGMAQLVDRLARRHAGRLSLGEPAVEVGSSGGSPRVRTASGETIRPEAVVLTVPAPAAAELLEGSAPATAAALGSLRYNPLALVHLLSDLRRDGYGFQVSLTERDLATRGVTWNYSLFGREGLSTAYLGGAVRPAVVEADDRTLGDRAAREFIRTTGSPARPIHVHRTRMPAFDETWRALREVGPDGDLPPGVHLCASYQVRPGIPGRLRRARALAERLAGGDRSRRIHGPRP